MNEPIPESEDPSEPSVREDMNYDKPSDPETNRAIRAYLDGAAPAPESFDRPDANSSPPSEADRAHAAEQIELARAALRTASERRNPPTEGTGG